MLGGSPVLGGRPVLGGSLCWGEAWVSGGGLGLRGRPGFFLTTGNRQDSGRSSSLLHTNNEAAGGGGASEETPDGSEVSTDGSPLSPGRSGSFPRSERRLLPLQTGSASWPQAPPPGQTRVGGRGAPILRSHSPPVNQWAEPGTQFLPVSRSPTAAPAHGRYSHGYWQHRCLAQRTLWLQPEAYCCPCT